MLDKLKSKFVKDEERPDDATTVRVEKECPDGGYGWIICVAAAVIQFIILGIHNSYSVLYTYLMKDMNTEPSETAWVGSIAFGVMFLCGPFTGGLCEKYGFRLVPAVGGLISVVGLLLTSFTDNLYVMYVTYSIVWGFGSSLNFAPATMVIGQYFRKRLTLANSIVVAGAGIGPLAMGPFYQFILSNHGWRVMLRILSGLAFVMFLCTLLYRPLPDKYKKQTKKESRNESRFFDLSVWKMKPFVVWVVSTSMMFIGYFVPFFHLYNNARSLGVPGYQSSLLIGYLSIASTVSRVGFGLVLDHPRINRFYFLQTSFLMMAVACTLCPVAWNYTGLVLYAVGFGVFDGCFVLLLAITTSDIVGPEKLPAALGGFYGVIAFPMILAPPLAGFIFQLSGSYDNAFFVAGGAIAMGACALSLIPFFMTNSKVQTKEIRQVLCQKDDTNQEFEDTPYWAEDGQRNSLYDTSNFALRRSISCLALSRLGDMCSTQCILEMIEQETIV